MKFVLILHVCSFLNITVPVCTATHIVPLEFNTYKDCILQGYKSSHNTLKELYNDKIEKDKLAIKFECRQVGEKV
jgi:MFS-type transporter involved in bile tolerance (Atg22 family)